MDEKRCEFWHADRLVADSPIVVHLAIDNAAGSLPRNGGAALRVQIVDHAHNFSPCTQCLDANRLLEIPDLDCRLGEQLVFGADLAWGGRVLRRGPLLGC